jgi:hypothetical protein
MGDGLALSRVEGFEEGVHRMLNFNWREASTMCTAPHPTGRVLAAPMLAGMAERGKKLYESGGNAFVPRASFGIFATSMAVALEATPPPQRPPA